MDYEKKIEIPFGAAKDSELGGFEYTIPNGYEAEIKDGKVIVRKADSEDEKIRKKLIESVKGDMVVGGKKDKEKAIAWLEKQGEQKPTAEEVLIKAGLKPYKDGNQWCILIGDNIQEGICGFGDTIEDALFKFLKEVIQFKQKAVDTSEIEMKRHNEGYVKGVHDAYNNVNQARSILNQLRKERPKQEHKPVKLTFDENDEPKLSEFEAALFSAVSDLWQSYMSGEEVNIALWAKEHSSKLMESATKQNPIEKHSCNCVHVGCHVNNCKRWCHSYQREVPYELCNELCEKYTNEHKPVKTTNSVLKLWHGVAEKCTDDTALILFHSTYDDSWNFSFSRNANWNVIDKWALLSDILKIANIEQKPVEEVNDADRDKELSLSLQIQAYLNTASDELYAKGKPLYSEKRIEDIHECMKMWTKLHNAYFYSNSQKLVEWSEKDEKIWKYLTQFYETRFRSNDVFFDTVTFADVVNWFISIKDKCLPQPKSEWSEEDKKMLGYAIKAVHYMYVGKHHSCVSEIYCKTAKWLKSLHPQPKNEWSDEDERIYTSIIDDTVQENQLCDEQINWLKSLRPTKNK